MEWVASSELPLNAQKCRQPRISAEHCRIPFQYDFTLLQHHRAIDVRQHATIVAVDNQARDAVLADFVDHVPESDAEGGIFVTVDQEAAFGVVDVENLQAADELVRRDGILIPGDRAFLGDADRGGAGGITGRPPSAGFSSPLTAS